TITAGIQAQVSVTTNALPDKITPEQPPVGISESTSTAEVLALPEKKSVSPTPMNTPALPSRSTTDGVLKTDDVLVLPPPTVQEESEIKTVEISTPPPSLFQ
ncbi:unnamed protein product, partial [marine sediment metagenome]